jgi:hypothetical protein
MRLRWLPLVWAAVLPGRLLPQAVSQFPPAGNVRALRQLLPQAVSLRLLADGARLLRRLLPQTSPVREMALPVPSLLQMPASGPVPSA